MKNPLKFIVIIGMIFTTISSCKEEEKEEPPQEHVIADFLANPTLGKAPLEVKILFNRSYSADRYIWDFGDGSSKSTEYTPKHTYNWPGTYTIQLTAINKTSKDTKIVTVDVL